MQNPTGMTRCCARRERPRGHRAAEQRDELPASHSRSLPCLRSRIAHPRTPETAASILLGGTEMIAITAPKIFSKEVAQNRPSHFRASNLTQRQKPFRGKFLGLGPE